MLQFLPEGQIFYNKNIKTQISGYGFQFVKHATKVLYVKNFTDATPMNMGQVIL